MSLDVYLDKCVFTKNITHNLNEMADKAGIYKELWRPEELDIYHAEELIVPLTEGLDRLKADPEYFKKFNPDNGWGNYEDLVNFVENYLKWCKMFPECTIRISR